MKYIFTLILFVASLSAYEEILDQRKLEILSPSLKEQKTAKIRLENGLEAYIISDPNTDASGAAISVAVGSWSNPEKYPGMAHFLEHMLFLGTEEYPDESEYMRFISDHGGDHNAFTAESMTNYMFSIDPNHLDEALSRFASFFKSPLLNTSQVERELKAIDQEYAQKVENETAREWYVHKSLLNPDHPSIKFYTGNIATLQGVSPKELRDFYETHYSAHLMRLIVIGREPLDQLKAMVENKFGGIPKKNTEKLIPNMPLFREEYKGKLIAIEPIKDTKTLSFIFEVPKDSPQTALNYILNYKGPGSLTAQLKSLNLAENVYSIKMSDRELCIEISLTDFGLKSWEQVASLTMAAVKAIAYAEIPEYLLNDLHKCQQVDYQFQTRTKVFDDLYAMSFNIHDEALETFPEKIWVPEASDVESIKALAKEMTIDKSYVYLVAKQDINPFPMDQKEKWIGALFGVHSLPEIKETSFEPVLPPENPFLPKDFALKTKEDEFSKPKSLVDNPRARIFFAGDDHGEPRVSFSFFIKDAAITVNDTKSHLLAEIYIQAIHDELTPVLASIGPAGHSVTLYSSIRGLHLEIDCYSDAAERLFAIVTDIIESKNLNFEKFCHYKETMMAKYQSVKFLSPAEMSSYLLEKALYKHAPGPDEILQTLESITQEDLCLFTEALFRESLLEGMIVGNLSSEEARAIAERSQEVFAKNERTKPLSKREMSDLNITEGPFYIKSENDASGNVALLIIETPSEPNHKTRAIMQVLTKALDEPFFSELRTKQQTGYHVKASSKDFDGRLCHLFFVQSSTHDPRDLLARFELFIEGFLQELTRDTLTEERFEMIRGSLLAEIESRTQNLSQTADLYSGLLFTRNGDFEWLEKRKAALTSLTYEETVEEIATVLGKENKRRLAILVKGKSTEFEYTEL